MIVPSQLSGGEGEVGAVCWGAATPWPLASGPSCGWHGGEALRTATASTSMCGEGAAPCSLASGTPSCSGDGEAVDTEDSTAASDAARLSPSTGGGAGEEALKTAVASTSLRVEAAVP